LATIQKRERHLLPEFLRSPSLPTLLIISALAIGATALLPLIQSSIATITNGNVYHLEQQRDDWQARIQEKELEVTTLASLERIEKAAKTDLKMEEPEETLYIKVKQAPPEPRELPSRYLPPAQKEGHSEPAIWEQLLDWLPLP
jgi:cell division protein FtsL